MLRFLGWGSAVTAASLALGSPAWAHPDGALPRVPEAALGLAWPATLAIGCVLVTLGALRARRRGVAALCLALFLVLAFEAGVHSAHHLTDGREAACAIASASAQTAGVAVERVACERPVDDPRPIALAAVVTAGMAPAAPDRGRAPPLTA